MSEKVTVQTMDPSKRNSPVAGPIESESTVMMDEADKVCFWNGQEFAEGQVIDCGGVAYECSFGQWIQQK